MRQAQLDSKSSQVNRHELGLGGDRDEMTLARLGKKQVLKVRRAVPDFTDMG